MEDNKKINIFYYIALLLVIPILIYLGISYYQDNKKIEIPDFTNKDYKEVIDWCSTLNSKYACEFKYTSSKDINQNRIINYKIDERDKLNIITFTVCDEKIEPIELPNLNNKLIKEDIRYWAHDNNIENITYIEQENDNYDYLEVIRIEPENNIYKDSEVTVYINKGNSGQKKEEDDKKEDSEDIIVKANDYIGLSVNDFESKVKALGLKPNHNTDRDASSSKVNKGNIVWHGSGTYYEGEIINYGICTGNVDTILISAETYVGLSESEFKSKAEDLGLKANHNVDRDAYSDSISKGKIVWHGSGEYEKGETFNYGLSLGKKDGSSSDDDSLYVNKDKYVGKTESEFKSIAESLGLKPTHLTDRDANSDTIAKGSIVTHGYGQYEKNEAFNYGLSLGKKDGSSSDDDSLYINKDKYVGKTESEFISIAESLGLKPTHLSDRDAYSDTIAKGSIVTHGYGQYEKNEAFNYGLSLGKKDGSSSDDDSLYVNKDKYVGKTENEFISIAESLGLKPTHLSDRDAYSDTIAKGSIVTHGYGQYEKNEAFNYGLSLGKNTSSNTISVPSFANKKESELLDFINKNGLKVGNKKESYSDGVSKGNIIINDTGEKKKGDSISYTISLGPQQVSTAYLNSFNDVANKILATGSYDGAVANAKEYLDSAGFTNYTFKASKSKDYGAGVLLSITVDGQDHISRTQYKTNAAIVFTICNGYE